MSKLCRLSTIAVAFVALFLSFQAVSTAATPTPSGSPSSTAGKAPSAPSGNDAAFGIQPGNSTGTGIDPTRSVFRPGVSPGGLVNDHVALVNIGTKPLTVRMYATDAIATQDGTFAIATSDVKPKDVGSWITIVGGSRQVTLPPRTAKGPSVSVYPFTLKVPQNASSGDHAGALVVALVTDIKSPAKPGDQAVAPKLEQRVGDRIYVHVTGPIHPGLTIDGLSANYHGGLLINPAGTGGVDVSYRVKNTGNVILGADQSASVSALLGGSVKIKGLDKIPDLLPGSSILVKAKATGVYPGLHLTATVHLSPTPEAGAVDPPLKPVSTSHGFWVIPWALVVIVLILLAGIGFLLSRRFGPHDPGRGDGRHSPTPPAPAKQRVSA